MSKYDIVMAQYKEKYDIDALSSPNDIANLQTMIRNQVLIDTLQDKINEYLENDDVLNQIANIKRLQDSLRDLIEQNLAIERTLGIDRKSRRKEDQESVADYWMELKKTAQQWLDKQLIYAYCPKCKVMVGRVLPAHDHTQFYAEFQCSQCKKYVTVKREERDTFFDLKERNKEWRKKHPIEIIQPEDTTNEKEYDDETIIE